MKGSKLALIEKACRLTDQTFNYILTRIRKGTTEQEISLDIQRFIRKSGAKLAFRPIVSFGNNSFEIHHKPTDKKLKIGHIIMLDFGAKVGGYYSDITRTVFFGKATNKQKGMYKTVLEAQKKAIDFINNHCHSERSEESRSFGLRPQDDIEGKEVDKIARSYIISRDYPTIPHGLGHGVGKKIHQYPRLSPKKNHKLQIGMAFTIEPGIYLKNYGGVRIEDTFVLEKKGLRQLTNSTKKLIEL